MRRPALILSLVLGLAACDVEPASERTFDTTAGADVVADLLAPDGANPAGCPLSEPAPNGACDSVDTCSYGQECCCGQCSASFVCTCSGGAWACYYTDFCLRPGCDDTSAPDAASDATWSDVAADLGADDASVGGDASNTSDTSNTTADDAGQEVGGACPSAAPMGQQGASCESGQRCEYGQECCCGECAPAMVCECYAGTWGCHNTDFCLIPGCPQDAPPQGKCRDQADCQGGAWCDDADQPMPCGICRHPEILCSADADCQNGEVCEEVQPPHLCLCETTRLCVPACASDEACGASGSCLDGHCGPKACAADLECPAFFGCDADTGTCARLPCAADAECGPGHCVNLRCFPEFGDCQLPVP